MLLHLGNLLLLSQQLKQLIIRDEVEPRELSSLLLKIDLEVLLDAVHLLVVLLEFTQLLIVAVEAHVLAGVHFLHQLVPRFVHLFE